MKQVIITLAALIGLFLSGCSSTETFAKPLEDPRVEQLANGHFTLLAPWKVRLKDANFTLQEGYTCNGITATDWQKEQMGNGPHRKETWCAIFHDWTFTQGMSRQRCDDYFNELMVQYKVAPWKRELMYTVVQARSVIRLQQQAGLRATN